MTFQTQTESVDLAADAEFVAEFTKAVPLGFAIDRSPSMGDPSPDGQPRYQGIMQGIQTCYDHVRGAADLSASVRFLVSLFDSSVEYHEPFGIREVPEIDFTPQGSGTDLKSGVERLERGLATYLNDLNQQGIGRSNPTIMILSDGASQTDPREVIGRLATMHYDKDLVLLGIGVMEEDRKRLKKYGVPFTWSLEEISWTEAIQIATVSAGRSLRGDIPDNQDDLLNDIRGLS